MAEKIAIKWWRQPDVIAAESQTLPSVSREEWYRFGHSSLLVDSEKVEFSRRFADVFSECALKSNEEAKFPRVALRVRSVPSVPEVIALHVVPTVLDAIDFAWQLLPERRYVECAEAAYRWRMLALPEAPREPVLAFGPSGLLVSSREPWQRLIAVYAISTAFRLQPDVFVFHAAAVGVSGKGTLLFGPKGAGKTTLSLCLASRGHAFLGDEWGVVSAETGQLLPLRRAASIRAGPQPTALADYLREHACATETLPDGTQRTRASVGAVFPAAPAEPVPLMHIFFLRRLAPRPRVERFALHGDGPPPISPLLASVSGRPNGRRVVDVFRALGRARWWHLDVGGTPEQTADLIEATVKEDRWD